MKAKVDEELCTACDLCSDLCPEVFEAGDDGKAIVKLEVVPADAEETCRQAVEECPVECISVED